MPEGRLLIYGASGHGKVVADAALNMGWQLVGFADDDCTKRAMSLFGVSVVAIGLEEAVAVSLAQRARVVVGIGSNTARKRIFDSLLERGVEIATIIHPRAAVAASVMVGRGTVIFAGAVVNPDTLVGSNVVVNTGATIDHDNIIDDHVHVSPGAHLGGTVRVGVGTHVGIGATVRNNLEIGPGSLIGAGAVVVKAVGAQVVVVGNPGRVVRAN